MVKKKSVKNSKRKTIKKKNVKGISRSKRLVRASKRKINLVLKNLILFIILFVLSFVLYYVSEQEIYVNLFGLLSVILGFIGVAFLIVLLVFLFLRAMKK